MPSAFGAGNNVQKGEQKDYYANERNYIHWLHMAVTLGSASFMTARMGTDESMASEHRYTTLIVSSILALMAMSFTFYSLHTFFWRRTAMAEATLGQHANIDEPLGPLILSTVLGIGLSLILLISWAESHGAASAVVRAKRLWPPLALYECLDSDDRGSGLAAPGPDRASPGPPGPGNYIPAGHVSM